jgi:hypothetical protein
MKHLAVFVVAASLLMPGTSSAQADAGYLADVQDGRVSVEYAELENRTHVILGLRPLGPTGGVPIALSLRASFTGRAVDPDRLESIVARAHYGLNSDDRPRAALALTDPFALRLRLDPDERHGITLFFFPTSWGLPGFSAPGDGFAIHVAYFTMTPADLRALAVAETIVGQVLWSNFVLSPAQLAAVRQFVRQVLSPTS